MGKAGPKGPQIEIKNWAEFETLCGMHCTIVEILHFFQKAHGKMSESTLKRRVKAHYGDSFERVYNRFQSMGKISLRRSIFKKATVEENVQMQIHLSKNWLGYSEKVESNSTLNAQVEGQLVESKVIITLPDNGRAAKDGKG